MTEDKDKNGPQDMDRAPDSTNAKPDSGDKKSIAVNYSLCLVAS